MNTHTSYSPLPAIRWQKRRLMILLYVVAMLIGSWFFPPTRAIWAVIDREMYFALNHLITKTMNLHLFWAFCNTRANDWVFDVVMLVFFLTYIFSPPNEKRKERVVIITIAILTMLFIFAFINRLIFHHILTIYRESPAMVFQEGRRISDLVTSIHVKEMAHNSYPGDHGTTACSFITMTAFTMGRKRAFVAVLLATPLLIMPRMVSGAHWFSDVIMGSFLIVIIPSTLIFCSPIFPYLTQTFFRIYFKKVPKTAS